MDISDKLLSSILQEGSGSSKFYTFANSEGKRWIIPIQDMATAMNLYQPGSLKGKAVKRLFPYLHRSRIVRSILHAERIECHLRQDLKDILYEKLATVGINFAIFGGTPGKHRKITIQLSKGNRILGYCKVCSNDGIYTLFRKECNLLEQLSEKGIRDIPECLYCGKLEDGHGIFLQSTAKTGNSRMVHEWSALHEDFLINLCRRTIQHLPFRNSDYCAVLNRLEAHLAWLPEGIDRSHIKNTIRKIKAAYKDKTVGFSAYHADFTPWNMFVENGRLFVFDFEYARSTYPPMLDRYHFFTQTAILEKHWDSGRIIRYIKSDKGQWIHRNEYILYIVEIMSRFCLREEGRPDRKLEQLFHTWFELLVYLES